MTVKTPSKLPARTSTCATTQWSRHPSEEHEDHAREHEGLHGAPATAHGGDSAFSASGISKASNSTFTPASSNAKTLRGKETKRSGDTGLSQDGWSGTSGFFQGVPYLH